LDTNTWRKVETITKESIGSAIVQELLTTLKL
jgi:hypothetical protein